MQDRKWPEKDFSSLHVSGRVHKVSGQTIKPRVELEIEKEIYLFNLKVLYLPPPSTPPPHPHLVPLKKKLKNISF
jgi:hypothetical protein